LLLDKLKASGSSRIINASAVAYQIAEPDLDDLKFEKREYQPGDAYAQSKLFIMWWTRHLAKQLEGW
jgi:NAD(P)-dependent dehydrogenase (short-subunit alcohol dehydrogenase family)